MKASPSDQRSILDIARFDQQATSLRHKAARIRLILRLHEQQRCQWRNGHHRIQMAIIHHEQQHGFQRHSVEQCCDLRCRFFDGDDVVQTLGAGQLFRGLDGRIGKQRAGSDGERTLRESDQCWRYCCGTKRRLSV